MSDIQSYGVNLLRQVEVFAHCQKYRRFTQMTVDSTLLPENAHRS